jgi:hypothetical protein
VKKGSNQNLFYSICLVHTESNFRYLPFSFYETFEVNAQKRKQILFVSWRLSEEHDEEADLSEHAARLSLFWRHEELGTSNVSESCYT